MRIMGFLGPQGTHSEAAALYLNAQLPEKRKLAAYPEIYAAMQAVVNGEIDECLVPVENSLEGSINITLDTLAHSDVLEVGMELIWSVHNQLMAKYPDVPIKKIFSHVQPLSQCRTYLKTYYAAADLIPVASTSRAAEIVAQGDAGCAAICTKRAGELYNLQTMATEIQDNMENCTRFYLLQRRGAVGANEVSDKALIICQIDGSRAGSLCEVLQEFGNRDVNMTRIESRPARTKLGAYIFFFDLETKTSIRNLESSIEAVRQKSIWLKNLGRFPVFRGKP